jgi:hypothetical protein
MNITTEESENSLIFKTTGIRATHYTFPKPSHTVTEVIIMTAALANGETILENSALEPEIDDLIEMLNSMGAKHLMPYFFIGFIIAAYIPSFGVMGVAAVGIAYAFLLVYRKPASN